MTKAPEMRERSVVRLSVTPSAKYSCSGSPPMLANGSNDEGEPRRGGLFRRGRRRLRLGRLADFERIDADRLGDVLELD